MDFALESITKGLDTSFFLRNGGLLGGAALITFLGLQTLKLNKDDFKSLQKHLCLEDYKVLKSSEWAEICFRMEDFSKLVPKAYKNFLYCIVAFLNFKAIPFKKTGSSVSYPRLTRKYLHPIIESVRYMRAELEKKYPSYLVDFDDIAADVQTLHDTCSTNIFLDH